MHHQEYSGLVLQYDLNRSDFKILENECKIRRDRIYHRIKICRLSRFGCRRSLDIGLRWRVELLWRRYYIKCHHWWWSNVCIQQRPCHTSSWQKIVNWISGNTLYIDTNLSSKFQMKLRREESLLKIKFKSSTCSFLDIHWFVRQCRRVCSSPDWCQLCQIGSKSVPKT